MRPGELKLSEEQLRALSAWASSNQGRRAERARVILQSSRGEPATRVGQELGLTVRTVYKWRQRFLQHGIDGLRDRARPGQPRRLPKERRDEIVRITTEELAPEGQRWTIRAVAKRLAVTQHQVRKVWSEHNLRPHAGRNCLVDERLLKGHLLRPLGLVVCPPYSVLALHASGDLGAATRLARRSPFPAGSALRAVFTHAQGGASTDMLAELLAFVARVEDASRAEAVHLLFSCRAPLLDPRVTSLLSGSSFASVSAKECAHTWVEGVQLWLDQAARADSEASAVASLGDAIVGYLARVPEPAGAFVWMREEPEIGAFAADVVARASSEGVGDIDQAAS